MSKIVLFNKPYGVLSQFTTPNSELTLANYISIPDIYPIGRLDKDSEGLLMLTDDGKLQQRLANPKYKCHKTYWVQTENIPNEAALMQLRTGILLNDGMTRPAKAKLIPEPVLWQRDPPIRSRLSIPTAWLEISITEGRNRQIRRMTAAVGFPTLRLIRIAIGQWQLGGLAPGELSIQFCPLKVTH